MDDARVDALYALPPDDFVAARDALVRELRAGGEAERAATVKALRRPPAPVWAVNQLGRRFPEVVERLLDAARALDAAQRKALAGGGADELRDALPIERAAVQELTDAARVALEEAGVGASPAALRQVSDTLHGAARGDPDLRERLRRGVLDRVLEPATGFGEGDATAPFAPAGPAAASTRRTAATGPRAATGKHGAATGKHAAATGKEATATGKHGAATGKHAAATGKHPAATGKHAAAKPEPGAATGGHRAGPSREPAATHRRAAAAARREAAAARKEELARETERRAELQRRRDQERLAERRRALAELEQQSRRLDQRATAAAARAEQAEEAAREARHSAREVQREAHVAHKALAAARRRADHR